MSLVCIIQTWIHAHVGLCLQFFYPCFHSTEPVSSVNCVWHLHIHGSSVSVWPFAVGKAWMETDCLLTSYWSQSLCHYVQALQSAVHPGPCKCLWFAAWSWPALKTSACCLISMDSQPSWIQVRACIFSPRLWDSSSWILKSLSVTACVITVHRRRGVAVFLKGMTARLGILWEHCGSRMYTRARRGTGLLGFIWHIIGRMSPWRVNISSRERLAEWMRGKYCLYLKHRF